MPGPGSQISIGEQEFDIVAPNTPEMQVAVNRGQQRGLDVKVLKGLPVDGVWLGPGKVAIAEDAMDPRSVLYHELTHEVSGQDEGRFMEDYRAIRAIDPQGSASGP